MSRSYKHTPRAGMKKDKFFKRYANRRLRHKSIDEQVFQHRNFKKDFCKWNICDYEEVGITFEVFYRQRIRAWYRWQMYHNEPFPTREAAWQEYLKWYKRK